MKNIDIIAAFEQEIGAVDDITLKPYTEDSLFWINQAVPKFVKLRFNGDLVHNTSFELTEKRRSDLINLVCESNLLEKQKITGYTNYDEYRYDYPVNFLYELSENVVICDNEGNHKTDASVFECTHDSFMYRINNSLTDFHYRSHKARPLRVRNSNYISLYTDKKYKIDEYRLTYLRKPNKITLDDPNGEYSDFEDSVIYEIIKIAAQMFLENKESKRYQTISQEVLTQE